MRVLRCQDAIWAGVLTAIILLITVVPAQIAAAEDTEVHRITMEINATHYIDVGRKIKRLAIANPKIADVSVLGASELNVVSLDKGSTALTVWLEDNTRINYMITVLPTDKGMAKEIERAIGLPNVHVEKVGDRVLLKGTVKHQKEMERAKKIAAMYIESSQTYDDEGNASGGDVNLVSLLEMENPVQINLEALVLDISTAKTSNFGFQYANASSISSNDTGGYDITFGTVGTFNGGQNYAHFGKPFLNVDVQVQALVQNGDARVLSRPNITTLSGEKAEILIGGSIPLPVTDSDGGVNVSWKDYGIKLNVEPKLDTDSKITAKVETEVSTLDYDHAVTSSVGTFPAMTKRTASAAINLESGMTMVIGGLLNSQDGKTIKKIPLLGDIPIIGEFFKHTSKTKDKRELMILIRPRIVESGEPARMSKELKEIYDKGEEFAESREYVDLNPSPVDEESVVETPFTNQDSEDPNSVEEQMVKGARYPTSEADNVLSEGAGDVAAPPVTPESTETTTLEAAETPAADALGNASDDEDLGKPLTRTESPENASAIIPESNESNLMDQRAGEAPTSSQGDDEDKAQPTASETKDTSDDQDKSKEDQAELMKKLAEKLSEVNALLLQVAEKDK